MRRLLALLVVVAAVSVAGMHERSEAHGGVPLCSTLENPVYLQVGDTQVNFMRRLARSLRDNTANPITMAWVTNGSCTNIEAMYNDVRVTTAFEYAPSIAEEADWNPAESPTRQCSVASGGQSIDIANSALFVASCPHGPPPGGIKSTLGPIQAYVLAVPEASSRKAISFEQAYFVFGYGMAGKIAPWDDNQQIFTRPGSKSTLLTWAANIAVPSAKWINRGTPMEKQSSGEVVVSLQNSPDPETAIGILGAEVYDSERDTLNSLAFRAKGQQYAYYPDSTSTARDKQNLRDGHYTVWAPTEWLQRVDPNNNPVSPNAGYVVNLIASKPVVASFDPVEHIAAVGLVPDCAMGVTRSFDGGPLALYQPAESCVCKYESLVATTSCQRCANGETCTSGTCRGGFCEAR